MDEEVPSSGFQVLSWYVLEVCVRKMFRNLNFSFLNLMV
jgi:hypothetical protein